MPPLWRTRAFWGPLGSLLSAAHGPADPTNRSEAADDQVGDQVIDLRGGAAPHDVIQVSRWFPATQQAIRQARRWVSSVAASAGHHELASTLELLVSELATNAVQHSPADRFLVELTSDQSVRVSVCDGSREDPRPRSALTTDTGGRGLAIVAGLADRWGAQPHGDGKCVWFQLNPHPVPAEPGI